MAERARAFVTLHERRLSIVVFVCGFLLDNLTLTRVDRLSDNLILLCYLATAFASILLLTARGAGRLQGPFAGKGVSVAALLLPFAFGGLFSGFLIFYFRSGSAIASAPFLVFLALFFLGNELFRKHYERFVFQMSVFFVALFSYTALIVPVLLRRIGDSVFIGSGLAALLLFYLMQKVIKRVARDEYVKSRRYLWPIVIMIFITFNFLYFNNMIPPVPLSLKEIGVYHAVSRAEEGKYLLRYEKAPWYRFGSVTAKVFHQAREEPAYIFSSVYAPANLVTEVVHRWSRFDEATGKWITENVVRFSISGGRLEGFRGYSVKGNLKEGRWRVDVETLRGQIIGRFTFSVVPATGTHRIIESLR